MADGVTNDFGLIARMLSDGFNRLDHRLDELTRRLDDKADLTRVAELDGRLVKHEIRVEERFAKLDERVQPLEDGAIVAAASTRTKVWVGNAAVLVIASSVGAFLYYVASLGGHG